jgi:hypothetical protein
MNHIEPTPILSTIFGKLEQVSRKAFLDAVALTSSKHFVADYG